MDTIDNMNKRVSKAELDFQKSETVIKRAIEEFKIFIQQFTTRVQECEQESNSTKRVASVLQHNFDKQQEIMAEFRNQTINDLLEVKSRMDNKMNVILK